MPAARIFQSSRHSHSGHFTRESLFGKSEMCREGRPIKGEPVASSCYCHSSLWFGERMLWNFPQQHELIGWLCLLPVSKENVGILPDTPWDLSHHAAHDENTTNAVSVCFYSDQIGCKPSFHAFFSSWLEDVARKLERWGPSDLWCLLYHHQQHQSKEDLVIEEMRKWMPHLRCPENLLMSLKL